MTRSQLKALVAKNFPKVWMKDSEDFDGRKNAVWTGEGSEMPDGLPAFGFYKEGYVFGVHQDLHNLLEKNGWYTESYDPGTFFFYGE